MREHSGYSGRIRDVRNIRRKGPFSETDELPTIFIKFRKIVGNLPLLGETLSRTLIAAGNAPFRDHFSHRVADLFRSDIWRILIRD